MRKLHQTALYSAKKVREEFRRNQKLEDKRFRLIAERLNRFDPSGSKMLALIKSNGKSMS